MTTQDVAVRDAEAMWHVVSLNFGVRIARYVHIMSVANSHLPVDMAIYA